MSGYMKEPCAHCPYRRDVKPFLTPERGEELAYHAQNPHNDFPCHKTTKSIDEVCDEYPEYMEGEMVSVETTKACAGFLTLMASECGEEHMPEGFKPSYELVYSEAYDMAAAYEGDDE